MKKAITQYYASKGGGSVKARARKPGKGKKAATYNSANSVKRSVMDDVKQTGADLVDLARKLSQRILGRE